MTAGNYYFTSLSTSGNFNFQVSGQVNIYVSGNVNVAGGVQTVNGKASNLHIYMLGSGTTATFSGGSEIYADIYAKIDGKHNRDRRLLRSYCRESAKPERLRGSASRRNSPANDRDRFHSDLPIIIQ